MIVLGLAALSFSLSGLERRLVQVASPALCAPVSARRMVDWCSPGEKQQLPGEF